MLLLPLLFPLIVLLSLTLVAVLSVLWLRLIGCVRAANALVREFCASDGLTERFCQTAVDVTFLAHQQKRPADELVMLQELATIVMREFRRRNCAREQFLSDELMRRFRSADVDDAKRGDGEAARRLAAVRAELRRVFLRETQAAESGPDDRPASHEPMSQSKFLTHLEKVKSRCADDRKWERSIALKAMDANESAVQEYIDPMEELRLSAEALEETMGRAAALQDMFREEIMNR